MNTTKNITSVLSIIIIFIILLFISFHLGTEYAGKSYQSSLDNMALKYQKEKEKILIKVKDKENEYNKNIAILKDTLNDQQVKYESALDTISERYDFELRESESRAEAYRNMSKVGDYTNRGLSDHAARLDRSLVEGRQLVRELREDIKLRDSQINYLGNQVIQAHEILE